MNRITLPSKYSGDTLKQVFDFASMIVAGETISSAQTFCTVYSGVDSNPQIVVNGAATISGTQVTQSFTGGVEGTLYWVRCQVVTSASQTLNLQGVLAVEGVGQL